MKTNLIAVEKISTEYKLIPLSVSIKEKKPMITFSRVINSSDKVYLIIEESPPNKKVFRENCYGSTIEKIKICIAKIIRYCLPFKKTLKR